MEKNRRKEAFGEAIEVFLDFLTRKGLVEDEAEALNMLSEYIGKRMIGQ